MENPFRIEFAVAPHQLIDRQTEVAQVQNALTKAGKLFMIGPRRYGKTSILVAAEEGLRKRAKIIHLNIQSFTSLEQVVRGLVNATAKLAPNAQQAARLVKEVFASLQPSLTYNPEKSTFSIALGVKPRTDESPAPMLVAALDEIEAYAQQSKQPVGVILDEFQEILKLGGSGIENQLRSAVQLHRHVGYVFAGSETTLLQDMINNPARPFYRLGIPLFIQSIPREDFSRAIRDAMASLQCVMEEEAMTRLLDLSEDVPYYVQLLAKTLWEQVQQHELRRITPTQVEQVFQSLIAMFDPVYANQWTVLTANQRRVLSAIADGHTQKLTSRQILREYDLNSGTIHKALQALESEHLVRREVSGVEVKYRLEDPLLKGWILRFVQDQRS
jgi:uncharacterized protein